MHNAQLTGIEINDNQNHCLMHASFVTSLIVLGRRVSCSVRRPVDISTPDFLTAQLRIKSIVSIDRLTQAWAMSVD